MTVFYRIRDNAPLFAFALLLLAPGAAIQCGLLSFDWRFEAMLLVSMLCIGICYFAGCSASELGLSTPWIGRHWAGGGAITLLLLAGVGLETQYAGGAAAQPDWLTFAPFYILISSPCQELVCRSIPKLLTDRLQLSAGKYVLFSSTVFALMHGAYGDPLLLLNCFLLGVVWATAYHLTRNLWPLVASHAMVGTAAFWLGAA